MRSPDFIIGPIDAPYLRRWWIIPRNRFFNIYLHQILKDDDDRALHDHPWASCSIILKGGYYEHTPNGKFWRHPLRPYLRRATALHRLELRKEVDVGQLAARGFTGYIVDESGRYMGKILRPIPTWSLFITGPKIHEWGFACKKGWMHWREYIGVRDGDARGDETVKGCGE